MQINNTYGLVGQNKNLYNKMNEKKNIHFGSIINPNEIKTEIKGINLKHDFLGNDRGYNILHYVWADKAKKILEFFNKDKEYFLKSTAFDSAHMAWTWPLNHSGTRKTKVILDAVKSSPELKRDILLHKDGFGNNCLFTTRGKDVGVLDFKFVDVPKPVSTSKLKVILNSIKDDPALLKDLFKHGEGNKGNSFLEEASSKKVKAVFDSIKENPKLTTDLLMENPNIKRNKSIDGIIVRLATETPDSENFDARDVKKIIDTFWGITNGSTLEASDKFSAIERTISKKVDEGGL